MDDLDYDCCHIWHPYAASPAAQQLYLVEEAKKTFIKIKGHGWVVDGMASWWSAIHGYNHPKINAALERQLARMSHVMFGGLTHMPAIDLARKLLSLVPAHLQHVFFADSGSVAVEVSLKMALQYWQGKGEKKTRFLTIAGGYHGDTFGAMSVCDPVSGMHQDFRGFLPQQLFALRPSFENEATALADFERLLSQHENEIAAVIVEPLVQGAGGMHFYPPSYLEKVFQLARNFGTLVIFDEIATGFGRTGKLFAFEHCRAVEPDILCIGKSLSGGYLTLAATLASEHVAAGVGLLRHGPTFMGNPLALTAANASIDLLLTSEWQGQVAVIEKTFYQLLVPLNTLSCVHDVRVMGAIGVVEFKRALNVAWTQRRLLELGVWLRPFGRLLYSMPAFNIEKESLKKLAFAMRVVAEEVESNAVGEE